MNSKLFVPIFLYKPEYTDVSDDGTERQVIMGQILVEFKRDELHLIDEWKEWIAAHGFPAASNFTEYVGGSQDSFVWCPTKDHMMMHRLAWGGKMAVD